MNIKKKKIIIKLLGGVKVYAVVPIHCREYKNL